MKAEFILFVTNRITAQKGQQAGGGRLYRLSSRSTLGIGGPAGEMRGYELGASKTALRTTGGIQLAALFVRRCRPGSGEECLCTVLVE